MRRTAILAALAISVTAIPAFAQQVVGSSLVDGRSVQLMSDFTWKYVSPTPAGCETVQGSVSFCGGNAGWTRTANSSPDVAAQYRLDDRNYGEFIVENLGSDGGIDIENFQKLVIENAASFAGVQPKEVMTFDSEPASVDGLSGETIAYALTVKGLPVIFVNTVVIEKHRTVQVATYSIGKNISDSMKTNHAAFLALTRLK